MIYNSGSTIGRGFDGVERVQKDRTSDLVGTWTPLTNWLSSNHVDPLSPRRRGGTWGSPTVYHGDYTTVGGESQGSETDDDGT